MRGGWLNQSCDDLAYSIFNYKTIPTIQTLNL